MIREIIQAKCDVCGVLLWEKNPCDAKLHDEDLVVAVDGKQVGVRFAVTDVILESSHLCDKHKIMALEAALKRLRSLGRAESAPVDRHSDFFLERVLPLARWTLGQWRGIRWDAETKEPEWITVDKSGTVMLSCGGEPHRNDVEWLPADNGSLHCSGEKVKKGVDYDWTLCRWQITPTIREMLEGEGEKAPEPAVLRSRAVLPILRDMWAEWNFDLDPGYITINRAGAIGMHVAEPSATGCFRWVSSSPSLLSDEEVSGSPFDPDRWKTYKWQITTTIREMLEGADE